VLVNGREGSLRALLVGNWIMNGPRDGTRDGTPFNHEEVEEEQGQANSISWHSRYHPLGKATICRSSLAIYFCSIIFCIPPATNICLLQLSLTDAKKPSQLLCLRSHLLFYSLNLGGILRAWPGTNACGRVLMFQIPQSHGGNWQEQYLP